MLALDVQGGVLAEGNPYLNFFNGFEYEPPLACAAMALYLVKIEEKEGKEDVQRKGGRG